jgi:hypothetical protein
MRKKELYKKIFMCPVVIHDFPSIHTTGLGVIDFFITLLDLQPVLGL